jgi:6-phosphofructokinase 1
MNVAVAGIPKTIDNDVDYIDRSFGFESAVEAAQVAIRSAKTEAICNMPNGVGIVKLMGRSAGYIAAHATMASGDIDLCLVPEVPIVLKGEQGCLPHIMRRVKEQGYAVIVVAEGAGEDVLGTSAETDASGNKKLPPIGTFMKSQVEEHFKENGTVATVKYIDPSYTVRSVPANAQDSLCKSSIGLNQIESEEKNVRTHFFVPFHYIEIDCMQLGQNAVHGAMAGFTGFSVGLCSNRMVFLPIPELVATSPRSMNPKGRTWERILALTRQPNTAE